MKIERSHPGFATVTRTGVTDRAKSCAAGWDDSNTQSGFTLIEVVLALGILAILMVVVHSVFYNAIQLRNKVDESIQNAIPLQQALRIIKRDVANVTLPGGTFTGTLQTELISGSMTNSILHEGEKCGPTFYTASGSISDAAPWSEMRKVSYYLEPSTNQTRGLDLIRSVTRNLLPVSTEEYTDQRLLSGVQRLAFQFYNGSQWVDDWDSTSTSTTSSTTSNSLPAGIRVQLWLVENDQGAISQSPIQMVVPIMVNATTNSTSSDTGGDQ